VHDATFSIENFRRSAGLGLRYNTPVGPVALDYGIKLDRRDGETFGRLHFNIGTTF
jgi:outer membrane protein insertion porin family